MGCLLELLPPLVILPHFSWNHLRVEPDLIAVPLLCLLWLPFALGILFDRRWAWYGSFAFSVLSLFVAFYVAGMSMTIAQHEGGSIMSWPEWVGAALAIAVVTLLLHTRHQFLKRDEKPVT